VSFVENQLLPDEEVVLLTHQHPMVLFWPILINIAAAAVVVALAFTLAVYWFLFFYLGPLLLLLWEVLVRHKKEYIITTRRVVKQQGIFSVSSFDASLDKINNIFHEQSLWGRILGYGNVRLETASEHGITVFHLIPDPLAFKNCIVQQRELYRSSQMGSLGSVRREDVPRMLDELASLRDRNVITAAEFDEKKKDLLARL
jgi:Bacterial PH domain/Short C-terminal domain